MDSVNWGIRSRTWVEGGTRAHQILLLTRRILSGAKRASFDSTTFRSGCARVRAGEGCSCIIVQADSVSVVGDEAIADAGFSEEVLRLFGIGFQFLAKLAHIHAQVLDVIGIGRIPDVCKDGLVG